MTRPELIAYTQQRIAGDRDSPPPRQAQAGQVATGQGPGQEGAGAGGGARGGFPVWTTEERAASSWLWKPIREE